LEDIKMNLLFASNEEANEWLKQHPAALGAIFLLLGLAVGGYGIFELSKGVAYNKFGKEVKGPQAKVASIVSIVAGAGLILFGLFKLMAG
jgi:hypothetical protein